MKKTTKGVTLVEVIVAIVVFSTVSFALFSSIIAMKKVVIRQEEYIRLEMTCYDISAYYEKYNKTWIEEYLGTNQNIIYLTSNFSPTVNSEESVYKIIVSENAILSISSMDGEDIYVENISLPIENGGDSQ